MEAKQAWKENIWTPTARLMRNEQYTVNARTLEVQLGSTPESIPSHTSSLHLQAFPRSKYHQQHNRTCGIKFHDKDTLRAFIDGIVTVKPSEVQRGRPTGQWRTIWT